MKTLRLLFVLCFATISAFAQNTGNAGKMTFQGSLFQNGEPVNGTVELTFSMPITDGTWTETISGVAVANGLYSVVLGNTNPIPNDLFMDASERSITVSVDGTSLGQVNIYPSFVPGVVKVDSLLANRMLIENDQGNYVEVTNNFYRIRNRDEAASSVYLTNGGTSRLQLADFDSLGATRSLSFFTARPNGNSNITMERFSDAGDRQFLLELYASDQFIDGSTLANGYARGGVDFYNTLGEQTTFITSMPGDVNGGDPDGWSGSFGMYGTNSINFTMEGKRWENNDLGSFQMYGEHTNGDGWYNRNVAMNVNSNGTNNWGQIELFNSVEGANGENRTVDIDGEAGNMYIAGDLTVDGTINSSIAPSIPDGGSLAINNADGIQTVDLNGNGYLDIKGAGGSPNATMGGRFWEGNDDLGYFNLTGSVQVNGGYPPAMNMNVNNDGTEQWANMSFDIQASDGSYGRPMALLNYDDFTGTGFLEFYDTQTIDDGNGPYYPNNARLGIDGGGMGYLELKGRGGEYYRVDANGLGGDINPSSISVTNPNNGEELANLITQSDGSQLNLRGSVGGLQEGGGVSLGTRWFAGGPQRGYVHVRGTVNPASYFDANLKFQMEAVDRGDGVETASFTMHGNELDGGNYALPVLNMTTVDNGSLTQWGAEVSMKRTEAGVETQTINFNSLDGSGYFSGNLVVDGILDADFNLDTLNLVGTGAKSATAVGDYYRLDDGDNGDFMELTDDYLRLRRNGDAASSVFLSNRSFGSDFTRLQITSHDETGAAKATNYFGSFPTGGMMTMQNGNAQQTVTVMADSARADFANPDGGAVSFGAIDSATDPAVGGTLPYFFMFGDDGGDAPFDVRVEDNGSGDYARIIMPGPNGNSLFFNALDGSGYFSGDLTVDGNINGNINPSVGNNDQGVLLDNQSVNFVRGGDGSGNGDLVVSLNSFDDGAGSDWGALDLNRDGINAIRMNAENADVNFTKDGESMYIFPSGINAGSDPYDRGYVINMDATGGPLMEMYTGGSQTINLNGDSGNGNFSGNLNAGGFSTNNAKANISSGNNGNGDFGTMQLQAPAGSQDRIDMGFAGTTEQYGFISIWKDNGGGTDEYSLMNVVEGGPGGAVYGSLFLKDDLGNSVSVNGYGDISASGDVGGTTLTSSDGMVQTSDKRFKSDVKTIDNALAKTTELRGVNYKWNKLAADIRNVNEGDNKIGVIAQELEKIFPELVKTGADGYKSVDYTSLTAVLIEAIKELNAEVKTLKAENEELKANATKTAELSKRIETIEKLLELKAESSTSSAKN